MLRITSILLLIIFTLPKLYAQDIKFGKVSKEELEEKFYPLDSSANAAVLYKKRRTYFEYSGNEGWRLITEVHERVKIYKKEGNDWATKKIALYDGRRGKENISIKAYTYNLSNNEIEKIKLNNSEIYDEEVSENWSRKKFTMPNLTQGSVVEWEYTVKSLYYSNIDDMVFQYDIPVKYIDIEISIPEFFKFKFLPSYYYPVKIVKSRDSKKFIYSYRTKQQTGLVSNSGIIGNSTQLKNASVDLMEEVYSSKESNIPALRDEPFVNNINNYRSKTSFELMAYTPKNELHEYFNNTWEDVTKSIYESSNFGGQLDKSSQFEDDLRGLIKDEMLLNEKVISILEFVKQKIKWNENYGKYTQKGVKQAYKDGIGNVAEINLTLVAMLRMAGLKANPVLVSTRDHGIPLFPTSEGFNYVVAGVEIQNEVVLLDATEKYSLPNILPLRVLNWVGRLVREDGSSSSVDLFLREHSAEKIFLNASINKEAMVSGMARVSYDNLLALNLRSQLNHLTEIELIGKKEKEYGDIDVLEFRMDNKDDLSKPLLQTLQFGAEGQAELIGDKIYFSPLLFLSKKENPFKLVDRKYPIDFGTPWEEKYSINIDLPDGYSAEFLPQNVAYALPENLGAFKFILVDKGSKIQVLSETKINTSIIPANYYAALKEFYKKLIEKQLEKVVLVKK